MQIVPLQAVPNQTVAVQLGGQSASVNVYAKTALFDPVYAPAGSTVIFCDVLIADIPVISGVPCWESNRIIRDAYLGFVGDLAFFDLQGSLDPQVSGLGSRWVLVWLDPSDLASLGFSA
jgi:hypothetical protein